ncbi:MAG: hypothetical protein HY351_01075 [Candidatus Omnitrophica bacterium]|nr:hypothetical protein [Candidatus Omnitrophota bacterium]
MKRRYQKLIVLVLAFLLLTVFIALFFHHHADGSHSLDCAVCRYVQQAVLFFVAAAIFIFASISSRYFYFSSEKLSAFLCISNLKNRAPPFLSIY